MPTPSFEGLYITTSRSFLLILNQNLSPCNISLWEQVFTPQGYLMQIWPTFLTSLRYLRTTIVSFRSSSPPLHDLYLRKNDPEECKDLPKDQENMTKWSQVGFIEEFKYPGKPSICVEQGERHCSWQSLTSICRWKLLCESAVTLIMPAIGHPSSPVRTLEAGVPQMMSNPYKPNIQQKIVPPVSQWGNRHGEDE